MPLPYKKASRTGLDTLFLVSVSHTHIIVTCFPLKFNFFEFNGAELSAECAPPLTLYKVTF